MRRQTRTRSLFPHWTSPGTYGSGGDHRKDAIFKTDHDRVPPRIMIQTESYPSRPSRAGWTSSIIPWLLGDFVWTAFDYIGEASIGWRGCWQEQGFFPWNLAFCGDIDICGWKRPQSYYRDALWKENQLSIFVTPPRRRSKKTPTGCRRASGTGSTWWLTGTGKDMRTALSA